MPTPDRLRRRRVRRAALYLRRRSPLAWRWLARGRRARLDGGGADARPRRARPGDGDRGHELRRLVTAVVVAGRVDTRLLAWRQGLVLQPGSGSLTTLPAGDPLVAPAVWSPLGEQLVLDVAGTADFEHLELADSVVLARYPIPASAAPRAARRVTRRSRLMARNWHSSAPPPARRGPGSQALGASSTTARLLDPSIQPVGFTSTGTLVGINRPASGSRHPRPRQCCGR